jgi:hypothetical protein
MRIHVLPHKSSPILMAMITGKIKRRPQQLDVTPLLGLQSIRVDQLVEYDAVSFCHEPVRTREKPCREDLDTHGFDALTCVGTNFGRRIGECFYGY